MPSSDSTPPQPDAETQSIDYEICRTSVVLMFLLEGMQAVRELRRIAPQHGDNEHWSIEQTAGFPMLEQVAVPLGLQGEQFDPTELLGPGGDAEQLAYRAWIDRIVRLTERESRDSVQSSSELRLIQQDLTENGGIASDRGSGSCALLTWFNAGERILFGMHHVLDLLNQRGLISHEAVRHPSGLEAAWLHDQLSSREREPDEAPPLVSVRVSPPSANGPGGRVGAVVVVFADGVMLDTTFPDPTSDELWRALRSDQVRIDEQGRLDLGDGTTIDNRALYREALNRILSR